MNVMAEAILCDAAGVTDTLSRRRRVALAMAMVMDTDTASRQLSSMVGTV